MSTTIKVMARAWGAAVAVTLGESTETFTLSPHEDRAITIEPGQEVTVKVSEPSEAPIPEATEEPLDPPVDAAAPVEGAAKFDHDGDGKVGGSKAKAAPKSVGDED